MGSFSSHHSSSSDGLNSGDKGRKSKRLMSKLRSRQSSRSDLIVTHAIDLNKLRFAQTLPDEGETHSQDHHSTTSADVDQILVALRDEEESAKNNNNAKAATPSHQQQKPVFDEDRQITFGSATHTGEQVETESTKHNADKAVSCNSAVTVETSRKENFQPAPRESSDKSEAIDGDDNIRICIETESWRTAKNWNCDTSSAAIRTDQGISSRGNVIVIREAPTTSSSESNFTDPESEAHEDNKTFNLTVTKLEQLNLTSSPTKLQIIHYEPLSFDGSADIEEMPIVKSSSEHENNGTDKGIFSVSRVKKVELSELPLATDICATPPSEQQTVTPAIVSGNSSSNNVVKASNGSGGKVMHRVITMTAASHDTSSKAPVKPAPAYVPEKLHFSAYEKFEGQMLMNWFAQSLQSIASSMTTTLNESDLITLTLQYCTNLLSAGVIRQLDTSQPNVDSFKPNSMYQWTHKEPLVPVTPGKLETGVVWPHSSDKKTSPKSREGESKIPKLMSSTPKARIQLITNLMTMTETPPIPLNTPETDHNKVNELKAKIAKCETIQEMFLLIKSFLNEYSMQSSESSSNSLTGSVLNGTDSTIFDRSMETTVFNVLQRPSELSKTQSTPKTRIVKSRTTPSTPTGPTSRTDPKRFRRNLSVESVSNASPLKQFEAVNGGGCKRCAQMLTSPLKNSAKLRMVDKATVMEVDPIVFPMAPEFVSIETQTESEAEAIKEIQEVKEIKQTEVSAAPIPPPPPMMNIPVPPPPPMPSAAKIPGPPPPPPPGPGSLIPAAPNLPPPPPFGLSSSPMPLPPPIALNAGPALRKKAINPPLSMKPLHWRRIVAPIKSIDATDGAQPPSLSPDEKDEDDEELWKEIDEIKLDNLDEFTELFSRPELIPKTKAATPLPKVKAIKVLDSKRSQNVGIFVRSIHVDFAEIEYAIYHCDTSVVSLETLQHIMEIKASNEELMMIKEAAATHTDGSPPLDAPENFLLKISQVSSFAERISCTVFQAEFDEQCTMVSRKLMTVKSLSEFLLENEGLKEVFSIILTLGNFMNGGNRQRGQADGFGLEILGKLKDTKSKDPKITLLHFIVKTYIERCRKNGCAISDLVLPTPNPNDVDKCLSIDFEECKQQLNSLKSKVEECRKTTEKVIAASAENCVEPFKHQMESFLEMAVKKIDSRFQKLTECQVVFIKIMKFYHFTPKKGTLEETPPAQFFEYWTSFTNDFNDIYKKELVLLTNALLKKTRQVTKPQSKPTSGENNLKARINRLKNRNN